MQEEPFFEYDVALSFAGEDRSYVEGVAEALQALGIRVFYDGFERADLWGKDLYVHLDEVYRKKASFCLMFLSRNYAAKIWASHERRSAQARALSQSEEYILPVRLDSTEIQGLQPTIGYIDAAEVAAPELAKIVAVKLRPSTRLPTDAVAPLTLAAVTEIMNSIYPTAAIDKDLQGEPKGQPAALRGFKIGTGKQK